MIYLANVIFVISLASYANSLPLGNATDGAGVANTFGCEPGEIKCSKCFHVLVNEIISSDRNRYNLQRAFFPSDTSNPVFIAVTYYFTRNMSGNGSTDYSLTSPNQTWFWTQSTFYLFQPVESLQYTSLLFSDPSLRESNVSLYLEPNCMETDPDMLKLLTQRLKLYAMEQKVSARISDVYDAKGESRKTLETFYKGQNPLVIQGKHLTRYTISFHVVFPVLVIVFLGFLFHHLIENYKINFFHHFRVEFGSTDDNADDERKWKPNISSKNLYIYIAVFGSLTFIVYVLVLDCLAVGYRNTRELGDIFFKQTTRDQFNNESVFYFEADYAIPHIMFAYDIFICLAVLFGLTCVGCGLKKSWYYVLLGPCSCVVVHSYHILVGYIHAPHHASAILIFYAISVLVFVVTYRTAYYNIVQCAKCCKKGDAMCCDCWKEMFNSEGSKEFGGNCCISREFTYWEAGFRKSLIHNCLLCMLVVLSLIIAGILVYVVILFLIVPINLAIDEAPTRLLNINQMILVFTTLAITYKLYRNKSNGTILDQLVKANTKKLKEAAVGERRRRQQQQQPPPQPQPQEQEGSQAAEAGQQQQPPPQPQPQEQEGSQAAEAGQQQQPPPQPQPQEQEGSQAAEAGQQQQPSPQPLTDKYKTWQSNDKSDKQIEMAEILLDALQAIKK